MRADSSKRLTIFTEAEKLALYGLPDFDDFQRAEFFAFNEEELALADRRRGDFERSNDRQICSGKPHCARSARTDSADPGPSLRATIILRLLSRLSGCRARSSGVRLSSAFRR
jgi:hypothetical protein